MKENENKQFDEIITDVEQVESTDDLLTAIEDNQTEIANGITKGKKNKKNKKDKPKMPKKKKIIIWVVSVVLVLAVIGGAVGGFFLWLGKPATGGDLSRDKLTLKAPITYVGTANDAKGKKGTAVEGAYNAFSYEEMFQLLSEGKDVVVHADEFKMTLALGTINLTSDLYANGLILDAEEVGKAGKTAISIPATDKRVKIYDLYITGKKVLEAKDNLKTFNDYSAMIQLSNSDPTKKAQAEIKHCIIENGHKVLHIERGADVTVEGTIIRNAADTTVSIGTFANLANKVYLKNNVIASSLTSGINVYCYDNAITNANAEASWNEITIDGFLDVYNWKSTRNLAFIPDSEGEFIANIANKVAGLEIAPLDKNTEYKVTLEEKNPNYDPSKEESAKNSKMLKNQYIHLAITKISTASIGKNDSVIKYANSNAETRNELKGAILPLTDTAKMILKYGYAYGYFDNNKAQVKIHDTISSNKNITDELINGRNY